jgi:hypothetical protein
MVETELGKRSAKEHFWQEHIAGWKASGLGQQVYCHNNHLAVSTFGYWLRKLKLPVCRSDKPRFYPLAVTIPHQACRQGENTLRLVLAENRFTIEISEEFSPSTLQRLILALEQL